MALESSLGPFDFYIRGVMNAWKPESGELDFQFNKVRERGRAVRGVIWEACEAMWIRFGGAVEGSEVGAAVGCLVHECADCVGAWSRKLARFRDEMCRETVRPCCTHVLTRPLWNVVCRADSAHACGCVRARRLTSTCLERRRVRSWAQGWEWGQAHNTATGGGRSKTGGQGNGVQFTPET